MRRINLCILLCMMASSYVYAADSVATWMQWKKIENLKVLDAKAIQPQRDSNRIRKIAVLDMRCDKTCLGLYTRRSQKPYAIISRDPLESLFNKTLAHDSSGYELLAVLNDLWLNEGRFFYSSLDISPSVVETANSRKQLMESVVHVSKLKCSIDVFILREAKYYPLVRIDSLFNSTKSLPGASEELIGKMLTLVNKKVNNGITANAYLSRRAGNVQSIETNYQNRYNIPALTDKGMKKGVYYSWEQFKSNRPENKTFRIQLNENEPSILYVVENNGTATLTRKAFAVSDGIKIYKIHQGYVFDMYRSNKSIYWNGIEDFSVKTKVIPVFAILPGATAAGTEAIGTKVNELLTPYLLNIETGEEY